MNGRFAPDVPSEAIEGAERPGSSDFTTPMSSRSPMVRTRVSALTVVRRLATARADAPLGPHGVVHVGERLRGGAERLDRAVVPDRLVQRELGRPTHGHDEVLIGSVV